MTAERIEKQAQKRQERLQRNRMGKVAKAFARRDALIELGKTVVTTETQGEDGTVIVHHDFPPTPRFRVPSIPSLSFLGAKTRKVGVPRKNRLRFKPEHVQAIAEDASRTLAKEIDKALAPEPEVVQQ